MGPVVKTIHIMVDQEVESKTGNQRPSLGDLLSPARPISLKIPRLSKECHLVRDKCPKHQPVGTFQI